MGSLMLHPVQSIFCMIIACAGCQYFLAYKPFMASVLSILISFLISAYGKKQQLKLPPGPWGVPVLGYLPFLGNLPHQKMAELAQKHGPLVYIQLGSVPGLVISSPQTMREVLVTQDHIFGSRPQSSTVMRYFGKGWHSSLAFSALGSVYRDMHRLYTQKLVSPQMVESFQPIRSGEMKAMVRGLWEDGQGGDNVNLHLAILALATNITTGMVLKKRYFGKNVENLEEARVFEQIKDIAGQTFGEVYLADFIPSLHPVTMLFNNERNIAKVGMHADAFIETIVEEHQRELNFVSPKLDEQANLVDVILNLVKDGQYNLDKHSLKTLVLEILLAGTDGIWISIEWAMAELLRHPYIMRKLQMELDAIMGTSRMVQEFDLPNLPYLQAVIRETFRLHPPGPFMIPHENTEATKIDGYDIPAQTRVFLNIWAMGRDPSVWDRPTEFDPSRFLNLTDMEKQDPKVKFSPFGWGRRGCPGKRAASLSVHVAVAVLAHSFDWSPYEELDMMELFTSAGLAAMKAPLSCINIQALRLPISLYTA